MQQSCPEKVEFIEQFDEFMFIKQTESNVRIKNVCGLGIEFVIEL